MASLLEKATSALTEAKDSVTSTAESVTASLTDAQKTVAASAETVTTEAVASAETVIKTEAEASTETAKAEAEATKAKMSTQAKEVVDKALTRGIEGAKALLHTFEEKRTEVSSRVVGAVTNVVGGGASSSTVASRDLPISTDNQPLLTSSDRGVETTPWWKNCCGVLDLLKTSSTTTTK